MITAQHIGLRVEDRAGHLGILRDLMPDWEDPAELPCRRQPKPMAFVHPLTGGREWQSAPSQWAPWTRATSEYL
ncbi:hypothetical protein [Streptomyces sp. NPDC048442]|uniref:hypothetical protein n=1 Tax=Streptomyces sp. NPDC048442 TaxID=3154823 RepID=UPI0034197DC5